MHKNPAIVVLSSAISSAQSFPIKYCFHCRQSKKEKLQLLYFVISRPKVYFPQIACKSPKTKNSCFKKEKKLFGMTPLKDLILQVFNYSLSTNSLGNLVDTF